VKRIRTGVLAVAAIGVAAVFAGTGRAADTSYDSSGTILFNGKPTFPIALSPGPPLGASTPWGTNGLAETSLAGVNLYRVGSGGAMWTASDLSSVLAWDRAAAALHVYTWPNLGGYSQATPGSPEDVGLANVIDTLTNDPSGSAIAMWKGRDEPWWGGIFPSQLEFAYCRVTGRGNPAWCAGETPLDPNQLWVTIEAPRGVAGDLALYNPVTDVHGVDDYPVTLKNPDPNLHSVGDWTALLDSLRPARPVWTTLQICSSGSWDSTTGAFVLPTYEQERYMAYDAIVNGAQSLTFFGGNVAGCWSGTDAQYGWNWTFWQGVLKPLVQQLSATSPLAPALVNSAETPRVTVSDPSTEVLLKEGTSVDDLWLIAARSGTGGTSVHFQGLPSWVHRGSVYTENRTVTASHGSFSDRFNQWDVHVYHFVEPLILRKQAPWRAAIGSHVTLKGKGLAAVKSITFGGARARFKLVSDNKIVATVPRKAKSGSTVLTSPLKQVKSRFHLVPGSVTKPRITGAAKVGRRLKATTGTWSGGAPKRYSFRWLGCNTRGTACKRLAGAAKRTLKLGPDQLGRRYRVVVTVRTASGRASARSAATATVTR
jgi:IPT/TIG domain